MLCLLVCVVLSVLIYYKIVKPCGYWRQKGIKHGRAWPLVGSMGKVLLKKQPYMGVAVDLYNKYPDERYVGYMQFSQQCLLIRDVHLIKQITVKDFGNFTNHAFFGQGSEADPLLNKSLVSLTGENWKNMRATLSPVFTSSKMRNMYLLIEECSENFVNHFDDEEVELETRDIFSKFACNVIASTAFGIKIDCLEDPKSEFFRMSSLLVEFTCWQTIKLLISQTSSKIANLFRIEIFPHCATKFFRSIVKDNILKRESEGIVRQDLIHLLMEARKGKLKVDAKDSKKEGFAAAEEAEADPAAQKTELTDEHIVAQAMLFFFAGFDTVSTTASFMAHELAVNPDVQKKLHEEISAAVRKHGTNIPYEALLSLKYLDQVVSETLRLWPAGFETDRLCVKDYLIPGENPDEKAFVVRKGVVAVISIMAIHRDPQFYPEPERFDPERFNDENKSKVIPGTYLPFGWGPRNCIGSRFALLEVKTLFYHLLAKFEIVPIQKTEIPVKISSKHFSMQPESGFWLGFKPRKDKS